jgi:hypothetical protein
LELLQPFLLILVDKLPGYPYIELRSVPLWASLIAGLRASAKIPVGVVDEITSDSVVTEYKRLWYISLPIIAVIFGFLAYMLNDIGMLTVGGGRS